MVEVTRWLTGRGGTRRAGRVLALFGLLVVAGVGALAYADRLDLRGIGRRLSTVRDSSLDAALKAKVRGALSLSRRASGMNVRLEVSSGVVTLVGVVPTQEARSIVEAIAADTPGVAGVQNQLSVDPAAAATGYERNLLDRVADLETQVALQERLRREPLLASARLTVEVDHGIAVLRGWGESQVERSTAQEIAQTTVGAEHVRNEIATLGPGREGEDRLARRVEFELYNAGAFDLVHIQVSSEAGRIKLEGSVRNQAELLLASRLAERVPGVGEVVNSLHIADRAS